MKNVGLFLLIWGGIGIANQALMIQSLQTGQAPTVPMIDTIDPASVLKIANPSGAGITSPGMLTDVAITAGGFFLWRRGHV
jgi:hypothetical protein